MRTPLLPAVLLLSALALPGGAQTPAPPTDQTAPTPTTPAPPGTAPAPTTPAPAPTPMTPVPATPIPTPEPERRHERFRIGPEIGLYFPTASKTRDRFGDTWPSLGIGIGPVQQPTQKGTFAGTVSFMYRQRSDHHVFLAPIGVTYRLALASESNARPYVGVTPALYLVDLRSPEDDVHSGLRATGGGSVFAGMTFGDTGDIELRYEAIATVKSFDLSGFLLSAGFRF